MSLQVMLVSLDGTMVGVGEGVGEGVGVGDTFNVVKDIVIPSLVTISHGATVTALALKLYVVSGIRPSMGILNGPMADNGSSSDLTLLYSNQTLMSVQFPISTRLPFKVAVLSVTASESMVVTLSSGPLKAARLTT